MHANSKKIFRLSSFAFRLFLSLQKKYKIMGIFSFFKKNKEVEKEQKQELDKGLEKTRVSVFDRISKAISTAEAIQ